MVDVQEILVEWLHYLIQPLHATDKATKAQDLFVHSYNICWASSMFCDSK